MWLDRKLVTYLLCEQYFVLGFNFFCFQLLSTFFVQMTNFMLSLFVSGYDDYLEKTCEFR